MSSSARINFPWKGRCRTVCFLGWCDWAFTQNVCYFVCVCLHVHCGWTISYCFLYFMLPLYKKLSLIYKKWATWCMRRAFTACSGKSIDVCCVTSINGMFPSIEPLMSRLPSKQCYHCSKAFPQKSNLSFENCYFKKQNNRISHNLCSRIK